MNERDYNRLLDRVEELEYRFNKLLDFVIRIDDHFGGIFGVTDQDSEIGTPIEPEWEDDEDEGS